jgi:hypothetical protein
MVDFISKSREKGEEKTEPLLPLSLTQVYNATFRFAAVQNRE